MKWEWQFDSNEYNVNRHQIAAKLLHNSFQCYKNYAQLSWATERQKDAVSSSNNIIHVAYDNAMNKKLPFA